MNRRRANLVRSLVAPLLLAAAGAILASCAFHRSLREGDRLLAEGRYAEALDAFERARRDPYRLEIEKAEARVRAARQTWAEALERASRDHEAAARPALAMLLAAQAAELTDDPSLRERARRLAQQVRETPRIAVRLLPAMELGPAAADAARHALADLPGVRVIVGDAPSEVRSLNVELACSAPTIQREDRTERKTVRYVAQRRPRPNPRHAELQRRLIDLGAAIARAQQAVQATYNETLLGDLAVRRGYDHAEGARYYAIRRNDQARAELERLRAEQRRVEEELRQTPPQIEDPVYDTLSFPAIVWSVQAAAHLRLRVDGEPLLDEPVRLETTGEMYDAQPRAGLPALAIPRPTDDEIRHNLGRLAGERAAAAIRDVLRRTFASGFPPETLPAAATTPDQVDAFLANRLLAPEPLDPPTAQRWAPWFDAATGIPRTLELVESLR